jgi:hypothetical protein
MAIPSLDMQPFYTNTTSLNSPILSLTVAYPFDSLDCVYFVIYRNHYGVDEVGCEEVLTNVAGGCQINFDWNLLQLYRGWDYAIRAFIGGELVCQDQGSISKLAENKSIYLCPVDLEINQK